MLIPFVISVLVSLFCLLLILAGKAEVVEVRAHVGLWLPRNSGRR